MIQNQNIENRDGYVAIKNELLPAGVYLLHLKMKRAIG